MHERRATALRRGSGSQVECPHFYTFARAGRITVIRIELRMSRLLNLITPHPVFVYPCQAGCALYGLCLHVCALYAHQAASV